MVRDAADCCEVDIPTESENPEQLDRSEGVDSSEELDKWEEVTHEKTMFSNTSYDRAVRHASDAQFLQ